MPKLWYLIDFMKETERSDSLILGISDHHRKSFTPISQSVQRWTIIFHTNHFEKQSYEEINHGK
jgi:hypothetical protein